MSTSNTDSTGPAPTVPASFTCRPIKSSDVAAMAALFFKSFNAPFWQYAIPHTDSGRKFWEEAWLMGLNDDTCRTFIVFDSSAKSEHEPEGRPAAFARWVVPQQDGNIDRLWPDLLEEWDQELMGAFFGGMEENRGVMMGKRPHWMLEMLGTHEDYQGCGLGAGLVKWGCDLADRDGLETYLDASERGAPFYQKHFAFKPGHKIDIPDRPAFGTFTYISHVRPVQS